jgi:hypothetical protein
MMMAVTMMLLMMPILVIIVTLAGFTTLILGGWGGLKCRLIYSINRLDLRIYHVFVSHSKAEPGSQRVRLCTLVASQSVDAEAGAEVQESHARDAGGVFRPAASHGDELAEGLRGEGHRRHGASMQEAARGQRQPLRGGR